MKKLKLNDLFDCYKSLLTENERKCFKDYYHDDYSLSEIAKSNGVSRSAVGKTIKNAQEKLNNYEVKIGLSKTKQSLRDCLEKENVEDIKRIIEKNL